MSTYRDANGKRLADYERPSVAVDTAVLTVPDGGPLSVLQVRDRTEGDWRLPGTFVHEGERLVDAVLRSLRDKAGVSGLAPRQLHVFDDPSRDDRGWVMSVAHLDVVPVGALGGAGGVPLGDAVASGRAIASDGAVASGSDGREARLTPVDQARGMVHGHDDILDFAVASLRADHAGRPDPHGLLAEPFTMSELRRLHEAVGGQRLLPDSFRRAMVPQLVEVPGKVAAGPGKPATRWRRG